jgi:hypothetical protein
VMKTLIVSLLVLSGFVNCDITERQTSIEIYNASSHALDSVIINAVGSRERFENIPAQGKSSKTITVHDYAKEGGFVIIIHAEGKKQYSTMFGYYQSLWDIKKRYPVTVNKDYTITVK